ncbi:DUF4134 domain-containing protein [Aquimarina pacifica]|uniref:DUF4134 domain-containing protein n=1 Tax=Aquimarina pacifica TaxID=1296415 RepID=UPI0004707069|nr:DUF4134 domain-containing protein [Aquimarina pacifica]
MKTRKLNTVMNKVMNIDVKSLTSKIRNPKLICTLLLTVLYIAPTFAQSDDINAQIETWGDQIKTILNAVVGIFSIAGGFLIFIQYMQGNEQAQKNFIRFIIGLAIFGLVALIANVFLPSAATDTI